MSGNATILVRRTVKINSLQEKSPTKNKEFWAELPDCTDFTVLQTLFC